MEKVRVGHQHSVLGENEWNKLETLAKSLKPIATKDLAMSDQSPKQQTLLVLSSRAWNSSIAERLA